MVALRRSDSSLLAAAQSPTGAPSRADRRSAPYNRGGESGMVKRWLKAAGRAGGRPAGRIRNRSGRRRMTGGKSNKAGHAARRVISPLLANLYMNRFLKFWRMITPRLSLGRSVFEELATPAGLVLRRREAPRARSGLEGRSRSRRRDNPVRPSGRPGASFEALASQERLRMRSMNFRPTPREPHWELRRMRECGAKFRGHLVTFADDFVILSRGRAEEALEWTRATPERVAHLC
jgi:hypothetical protein